MNCTKGVQTGRRWLIGSMNLCYRLNADFYVHNIASNSIPDVRTVPYVLTLSIDTYHVQYDTGTGIVIKNVPVLEGTVVFFVIHIKKGHYKHIQTQQDK